MVNMLRTPLPCSAPITKMTPTIANASTDSCFPISSIFCCRGVFTVSISCDGECLQKTGYRIGLCECVGVSE